ncbi:MAG: hypothetical protein A4S15_00940 [Candidatus Raskinella chloraquaticus]|uniref:Uncharacterized protein n=2 Tax=Candidatus Raskinella chloraquaticus TaxID=1951219 RepID=A0A1W9HS17_9HYPH|nr:MAG: hypothetical protein A4S15_00940 [Proteobacteria bacterium SG_bin8]
MTLKIPDTPRTPDALQEMFERTTTENLWREKAGELLASVKHDQVFRHKFHTYWTVAGHRIRAQIDDDKVLISLLRLILPLYVGPGRTLYRGENLDRWNSRRIGLCWSDKIETARMFGRGLNATGAGGVLLQWQASNHAIIAGPSAHSPYLGESEYTLDLSETSEIEEIEQYPSSG